jgi:hypothetical protein
VEGVDPNVLLCVAQAVAEDAPSDNFLDEVSEWCVEHGFEFVDLNDKPEATGKGKIVGVHHIHSDPISLTLLVTDRQYEDKVGADRIVEALESNMWGSMKRKQLNGNSGPLQVVSSKEDEHENPLSLDSLNLEDDYGDFEGTSRAR